MADLTPQNDPLGDRLRATFAAEHADVERRQVAGVGPSSSRSLKWIPFAVAAAVVAIAGFVFIGNRSSDQAVELDVAAQTQDEPAPVDGPAPTDETADDDQSAPTPQPIFTEDVAFVSGVDQCGDNFAPDRAVVRHPDGLSVPAFAPPDALGEMRIVRELLPESAAVLAGGCVRSESASGPNDSPVQWYEIVNPAGGPNEWVLSDFLHTSEIPGNVIRPPLPENVQIAGNECGAEVPLVPHFIWGIPVSDPDGGLVAHTAPQVAAPVTRIIGRDRVVVPTGGCVLVGNGAAWYQLYGAEGSLEWVNARYLQATEPACIVGRQMGTAVHGTAPDEEPFFHTVQTGDRLASIAEKYNVTVDVIIRANPQLDPNLIIFGELLRIPGADASSLLFVGPADGWAAPSNDFIAFAESRGPSPFDPTVPTTDDRFRLYSTQGVAVGAPCFQDDQPIKPVCLGGDIVLINLQDADLNWVGANPVTAWTTGRVIGPPQIVDSAELVEVEIDDVLGLIDPARTAIADGHCEDLAPIDSLDAQPCMRVAAPVRSSSEDPLEYLRWPAGDAESTADHVHDIRTESNDTCTRVVITFGDNANDTADRPAALLPPVFVDQGLEFVRITANGWQMESAFMDPDRVDYPGGIGLLTLSPGFTFAVDLMHRQMEPNVRFLDNPARVVVDLFPIDDADLLSTGPFGEDFVLRGPIQNDLTGQGVPGNGIVVAGFGRPFEAAGLYRIWSVPDDVDAQAFLADPPTPLIEAFFPTTGWAEAWGSFSIDLPDLAPGSYIAVFGELPPTDEIGFYGAGQLFRVVDAATEEPGTWPEAMLLPDVQLPPE